MAPPDSTALAPRVPLYPFVSEVQENSYFKDHPHFVPAGILPGRAVQVPMNHRGHNLIDTFLDLPARVKLAIRARVPSMEALCTLCVRLAWPRL